MTRELSLELNLEANLAESKRNGKILKRKINFGKTLMTTQASNSSGKKLGMNLMIFSISKQMMKE